MSSPAKGFPFMPYPGYRHLTDEDLASVIVYLRSLAPVHHLVPRTEIIFPVRYLMRSDPEPIPARVPSPNLSNPVERGKYLVTVGGCSDCHTPQHKGKPIPGLDYAGGFMMKGPWGSAATANITPDASGISYYDEALFLQTMRSGFVPARRLTEIMPWWSFRNLPDEDLKAIFAYLRTLRPVKHRVDNTEPPTYCKLCGGMHGLGNQD